MLGKCISRTVATLYGRVANYLNGWEHSRRRPCWQGGLPGSFCTENLGPLRRAFFVSEPAELQSERRVTLPSRGLPTYQHGLKALVPDRLHDLVGVNVQTVVAEVDSDLFEMIDQHLDLIELAEDHASRFVLN